MGIILKHSLKNILSKPLRLVVLILCITMATFAALLAFDMGNNLTSLMKGYVMHIYGDTNIVVIGADDEVIDGIDARYVGINVGHNVTYAHDETDYNYIEEERFTLYSMSSMEEACSLKVLGGTYELDDTTALASPSFVEKYDKEVGDTVVLNTADGEQIELTISDIYQIDSSIMTKDSLVISENVMNRVNCSLVSRHTMWFISADESKIEDICTSIRHDAPDAKVFDLHTAQDDPFTVNTTNIFSLIFLVTLLLVTFVTISLSEKIVNERMSVIGTLRSLGVRSRKTAFILLVENALYAVIGSVIGTLLFVAFKIPLINTVVQYTDNNGDPLDLSKYYQKTPVSLCLIVILGAVLLECAYPLYELLKAVKTPIRDIIFNNKDTEFKYTWRRLYVGAGLTIVSIVTAFMVKNFTLLAISLGCGVVALGVLLPYIIRFLAGVLASMFNTKPVAKLAAENISRNKSLMGNSILAVISVLLSMLVLAVCGPVWKWLCPDKLKYDVRADISYVDGVDYSYFANIDGIKEMDIERAYYAYGTLSLAGTEPPEEDKEMAPLFALAADEPHTLSSYLPRETYSLEEDEIVISDTLARKYGISVGDEVDFTLNSDSDFPTVITFKVVDTYDTYDISGEFVPDYTKVLIINSDLYDHMFMGYIHDVLFTTDDPLALQAELKKCTDSSSSSVKTADEVMEDMWTDSQGLHSILNSIVFGSVVLTMIGVAGNQTFAFITRKRETALLYSVVMGRKKIRRLLFLESLFSIGLSALIALVSAPIFFVSLSHVLTILSEDEINILKTALIDFGTIFLLVAVIVAIYIATVIAPVRALRKMNIAEELKYE